MDKLMKLSNELVQEVKRKEREIDNPVIVMSLLSELEFFKEALQGEVK